VDPLGLAVILGIVEGLTEFIPVSSTGHLILAGYLLGFVGEKAASFEVAIQLGAILSVVVLYRRRFVALLPGLPASLPGADSTLKGFSGVLRVAVATLPALIVGYLARHVIKERLFTPSAVTWALVLGGLAILLAERVIARRRTHSLETLTLTQAFAATIVGGMLLGLERKGAAEFSFLIAVPIMLAATGYELIKMRGFFAAEDFTQLAVGFAVSFIVALLAVKSFVSFLSRWSLAPFAYYRIAVAVIFYFITRGMTL
jgi:undecaprenyl-diphosphatase